MRPPLSRSYADSGHSDSASRPPKPSAEVFSDCFSYASLAPPPTALRYVVGTFAKLPVKSSPSKKCGRGAFVSSVWSLDYLPSQQ